MKNQYIYTERDKYALILPTMFFIMGMVFIPFGFFIIIQDPVISLIPLIMGFFFFGYGIHRYLKRKLIINDQGIQFYIGNDLKIDRTWDQVESIELGADLPDMSSAIYITARGYDSFRTISHLHRKQIKEAYDKMVNYAIKYDFKYEKY